MDTNFHPVYNMTMSSKFGNKSTSSRPVLLSNAFKQCLLFLYCVNMLISLLHVEKYNLSKVALYMELKITAFIVDDRETGSSIQIFSFHKLLLESVDKRLR